MFGFLVLVICLLVIDVIVYLFCFVFVLFVFGCLRVGGLFVCGGLSWFGLGCLIVLLIVFML